MKFLMISKCGEGAQLLYNIANEGNEVRLYIEGKEDRKNWKGILPQIVKPIPQEDEVIIFDQSSMGSLADSLSVRNPVFGGSRWADMLENDRMYGLRVMEMCGIKTPETKSFNNTQWWAAEDFIKENKSKKYVFKPSGPCLPSKLSYVPSDEEDLLLYINFIKKAYGDDIENFVLQEFIKGTIVSTEFWCDGTRFIRPSNHTVEVKKLMNDELGPSTGCSGNLIWPCWDNCLLTEDGVEKIEQKCVEENYRGCIDLNAIVNDDGLFGLEWTPRFGYDALPTMLQLIDMEVGKFFSDLARRQCNYEFPFGNSYAAGVRLTIPPYPLEPPKTSDVKKVGPNCGIPIRGFKESDRDKIFFFEIMKDEDGQIVHSEGVGAILVASNASESLDGCFESINSILEDAKIPDKQYRTDLSSVLPAMCEEVMDLEGS